MTRAHVRLARGGLAALVLLCLGAGSLRAADEAFEPLRTPWGTPDMQGIWDFRTLTPMERPPELGDKAVLTPAEAEDFRQQALAVVDVDSQRDGEILDVERAYNSFWWDWGTELTEDLRTSLIVDPPDGRLPALTAEAKARLKEQAELRTPPVRDLFSYSSDPKTFRPAGPESVGLSERCLVGFNAGPPFSPGAYNNNLRIVQTEDYVVLVTEMIHDARIVPKDDRPRLPGHVERWSGDSRARWEGETLVVETTSFSDKKPTIQLPATLETLDETGGAGSARNMHLVERFTLTAQDRLLYEYTLTDPKTFVRPFTVQIPLRASEERMFEYACHEGNYAMPGMLKGARLLDAETAQASSGGGR